MESSIKQIFSENRGNLTMEQRLELWKATKNDGKPNLARSPLKPKDNCLTPKKQKEEENDENNKPNKSVLGSAIKPSCNAILRNEFAACKKALHESQNENKIISENLSRECEKNKELLNRIVQLEEREVENYARCELAREDVETMMFVSSLNELKVQEMEVQLTRKKMDQFENKRNKKFRDEYEKLQKEKSSYEQQANTYINELQQQMQLLQQTAMSRIEFLQKELQSEVLKNTELQAKILKLERKSEGSSNRRSSSVHTTRRQSTLLPLPLLEEEIEDSIDMSSELLQEEREFFDEYND